MQHINTVHIIGLGLIGCSIAQNLKANQKNLNIIGVDSNPDHLDQALKHHHIDHIITLDDLQKKTDSALNIKTELDLELVIVAIPISAITTIFSLLKPYITPNTILTDVGSVKSAVISSAEKTLGKIIARQQFVPGHPLAGRAIHGPSAAQIDLFKQKKIILTPDPEAHLTALETVRELWALCQTDQIELMEPEQHDNIVAQISHLPQLLSYSYMNSFVGQENIIPYGAGGFAYLTHLASSDPVMWRDICSANGAAIKKVLANYESQLNEIKNLINNNDTEQLAQLFARANQLKKLNP